MVEKPKDANETQQNGGNKPNEKTKPAKMPEPLVEQAPQPAKNSRLRDSERTIPLIYPPGLLETQKSKQNSDKNSNDSTNNEERELAEDDSEGAKGGETLESTQASESKSIIARLKLRLKLKKEE